MARLCLLFRLNSTARLTYRTARLCPLKLPVSIARVQASIAASPDALSHVRASPVRAATAAAAGPASAAPAIKTRITTMQSSAGLRRLANMAVSRPWAGTMDAASVAAPLPTYARRRQKWVIAGHPAPDERLQPHCSGLQCMLPMPDQRFYPGHRCFVPALPYTAGILPLLLSPRSGQA